MRLYQLKIKNFRGLKGDGNIIKFDNSDIIIIGPGDLYTSIIPNLLVK